MGDERFEFSNKNKDLIDDILEQYEDKQSALLPILHLVQEQNGYISKAAIEVIHRIFDMPVVKIEEVVSFYPF